MNSRFEVYQDCGNFNNPRIKVKDAAFRLATVLQSEELWATIRKIKAFAFSSTGKGPISGEDLEKIFKTNMIIAEVRFYKTRWPWSNVLAYVQGNNPKTIYINERKLNRSEASIAATIAHEYIHVLDNYTPESFGHGDNYASGKDNSAPYYFGQVVEEVYGGFYERLWKGQQSK